YLVWPFNMQLTSLEIEQLGIPRQRMPLVLTIAQSSEILTLALLSFLLNWLEQKRTMLLGITCYLAAMIVLTIAGPRSLVVSSLFLHGFFITCFPVAGQVYMHSLAEADYRASLQGIFLVINGAGLLVGNFLVGWIRGLVGDDYGKAFLPAAIIVAMLTIVFLLGFRTEEDDPSAGPDLRGSERTA